MDQLPDPNDRNDLSAVLQQRMGEQYPITVPISFAPPPTGRWRPKPSPTRVMTEDWSYTGLGFVTETRDDLGVALPIIITIGAVTGEALVQVVDPTDNPETSHYGIEFRDQALENVARDLISIHLTRVPSDRRARQATTEILGSSGPDQSIWH